MEKQYSVKFFQSLVETMQHLCREYLNFNKFVEVSGYISIEIDNAKKERYVLSELLQTSGHTLSESYCIKAFKTCYSWNNGNGSSVEMMKNRGDEQLQSSRQVGQSNADQNRVILRDQGYRNQRFAKDISSEVEIVDVSDSPEQSVSSVSMAKDWTPKTISRSFSSGGSGVSNSVDQTKRRSNNQQSNDLANAAPRECFGQGISSASSSQSSIAKCFPGNSHRVKHETGHKAFVVSSESQPRLSTSTSGSTSTPVSANLSDEIKVTLPQGLDRPPDDIEVKPDPEASNIMDEDDTIDIDLYDDDLNDSQADFSSLMMEDQNYQSFSASPIPSRGRNRRSSSQCNPYIEKVTRYAVKKLDKFCYTKTGNHINLVTLPPVELDSILSDFFNGLRKQDGSPYEPRSLRTMQCNIEKHLKNEGYSWSILKDPQFNGSRETLKSLLGYRTKNRPQFRYNPLTDQDIETLFVTEQLGLSSPESLINSMWLLNVNFFGIKSLTEHFHLKWGDMVLLEDDKGREYLQHVLKGGQLGGPQIYAKPQNPPRCFVKLYKEYTANRPASALEQTSPFYLCVGRTADHHGWFTAEPLSWYKLASLWKKMVQAAGLPQDKKPMFNLQFASTGSAGFHNV